MLRPTFMGFNTALRGIQISQKGLDITGQNMVNWDSTGYTRQRIDQVSVASSYYTTRFATNRISVAGQGVDIQGVAQIRDKFLDKRFRDEYSDEGYHQQVANLLSDIEAAIGEYLPNSDAGIRNNLLSLFESLQKFAEQPSSKTDANIVRTEFSTLIQTLQHLSGKLDSVDKQYKYNLEVSVSDVNSKLQQIANINYAILQDTGITLNSEYYGPNELLDQRNVLLDELSQLVDVDVTYHPDQTISVGIAGVTAVKGDKYEKLVMDENYNGTVSVNWLSSGKKANFTSGVIKATSDFINGRGNNVIAAGETHDKGIRYYRDKLNTFSNTLAGVVNSIIPEYDASGTFTGYKTLLGGVTNTIGPGGNYIVSKNIPITAENISLSDEWAADSAYIIAEEDSLNNNYIHNLYTALFSKDATFRGNGEIFTGTFLEFVNDYAATLAEEIKYYSGRADATTVIVDQLLTSREAISGVNMDEETANMLMYNKSFQAASRLMTALDEALDVLINRTGIVGR